jgi:multidrug efflux pump subunit AcrA (membrane-fusion protein)
MLTVPAASVVMRDEAQQVLLVQDGRVSARTVTTGQRIGDRVEITGGLAAGDRVVRQPSPDLRDGASVKIKE